MKRHVIIAVVVLSAAAGIGMLHAGDTGRGGAAGSFLRMGLGARAMALGGGSVAMQNEAYALYYNPAGLVFLAKRYATTSLNTMSLDRYTFYAGYAQAVGGNKKGLPRVGLSAGWLSAGVTDIDGRDFNGSHTAMYSSSENAFFFSFAFHPLPVLALGLTGKILYHIFPGIIETGESMSATGVGVDIGLLFRPFSFLSAAFVIKDIQEKYTWDSQGLYEQGTQTVDRLPSALRGGVAGTFWKDRITAFVDVEKTEAWPVVFSGGIEVQPMDGFWLRGGLWKRQITLGGGYRFHLWQIGTQLDYAYVPDTITPRGNHVFSWSFIF